MTDLCFAALQFAGVMLWQNGTVKRRSVIRLLLEGFSKGNGIIFSFHFWMWPRHFHTIFTFNCLRRRVIFAKSLY